MVDFGIDDDEVVFSQGDLGFIGAQPSFAVGYVEEFGTVLGGVGGAAGVRGISLLRNRIGWTYGDLLWKLVGWRADEIEHLLLGTDNRW